MHVAVRLLTDGRVAPKQLCIIDPGPELLHRWMLHGEHGDAIPALTGRAPCGVEPFGLLSAGRRKRDRKRRDLFTPPYNRPSLALFTGLHRGEGA